MKKFYKRKKKKKKKKKKKHILNPCVAGGLFSKYD